MPTGFAPTTQKGDHCINSLLKKIKKKYPHVVDGSREYWNEYDLNRNLQISLEQILNPEYKKLEITSKTCNWSSSLSSYVKYHLRIYKGLWCIQTEQYQGFITFNISAVVGDTYRFHPQAIESHIISNYGRVVYEEWKAAVLEDLDSVKVIVEEARRRIPKTYWSPTSCERSTRFCKRVGIPVRSGIAFLFPSKVDTNGL